MRQTNSSWLMLGLAAVVLMLALPPNGFAQDNTNADDEALGAVTGDALQTSEAAALEPVPKQPYVSMLITFDVPILGDGGLDFDAGGISPLAEKNVGTIDTSPGLFFGGIWLATEPLIAGGVKGDLLGYMLFVATLGNADLDQGTPAPMPKPNHLRPVGLPATNDASVKARLAAGF